MKLESHWLARSAGAAAIVPALLVLVVGATLWLLDRPGTGQPRAILAAVAAVALGCVALAAIRPQRAGLSPPQVMLSLGFGGMLLGLLYDSYQIGPDRLVDLCAEAASLALIDGFRLHLAFLPGMHAGMLAGGLLAIPSLRLLRPHCGRYLCSLFAQNLLCSGWMLSGMTAGAIWLSRWPGFDGAGTPAGLLGGMFAGMTWGMVISVALYRGFFAWRDAFGSGQRKVL